MILNKKPLDENNFEDWKMNLYIVLDYEKIKFVLALQEKRSSLTVFHRQDKGYLSR